MLKFKIISRMYFLMNIEASLYSSKTMNFILQEFKIFLKYFRPLA
jgi:hypothetical protein